MTETTIEAMAAGVLARSTRVRILLHMRGMGYRAARIVFRDLALDWYGWPRG